MPDSLAVQPAPHKAFAQKTDYFGARVRLQRRGESRRIACPNHGSSREESQAGLYTVATSSCGIDRCRDSPVCRTNASLLP